MALYSLPTLFRNPDSEIDERRPATDTRIIHEDVFEGSNFDMAVRRILCPNCVLNIFLINSLVVRKTVIQIKGFFSATLLYVVAGKICPDKNL